ncbi:pro-resilin [Cherax quadricarinatus]|uniref:pro-resilin n=1 Tax=Cherax quadricarinatus TaxID=27406 RepID=UPI00387E59F3
MNTQIVLVLCVVVMAAADKRPSFSYGPPRVFSDESFESSEAKYNFNWAVDHDPSSNEFGHQESRDGDDTQGSYYVQLPDGRLQKVTFLVDGDSGYQAQVTYEGEARYSDESRSFESLEYAPRRAVYG